MPKQQQLLNLLQKLSANIPSLEGFESGNNLQLLERENQTYVVLTLPNLDQANAQSVHQTLNTELAKLWPNEKIQIVLSAQKSSQSPNPQSPKRILKRPDGVRHIIAVASGKGGVGKSTLSALVAMGLADEGLKVGLLDADIYGPSMPTMFGILDQKPTQVAERLMAPVQSSGIHIISIGLMLDPTQALVWRGPMIISAIKQLLYEVQWPDIDVLVVDLPPGTGDAQLTLAQNVPLDGVLIVSTPQELALADARRAINMFEKLDVKILGMVENMSHYLCPSCSETHELFAKKANSNPKLNIKVEKLGQLAFSPKVQHLFDEGEAKKAYQESIARFKDLKNIIQKMKAKCSI